MDRPKDYKVEAAQIAGQICGYIQDNENFMHADDIEILVNAQRILEYESRGELLTRDMRKELEDANDGP